jgi:hypothetical protein
MMVWDGLRWDMFTAAAALLMIMGLLSFATALGLWYREPWASRATVILAGVILVSNLSTYAASGLLQETHTPLLLLFPIVFSVAISWYFRRPLVCQKKYPVVTPVHCREHHPAKSA